MNYATMIGLPDSLGAIAVIFAFYAIFYITFRAGRKAMAAIDAAMVRDRKTLDATDDKTIYDTPENYAAGYADAIAEDSQREMDSLQWRRYYLIIADEAMDAQFLLADHCEAIAINEQFDYAMADRAERYRNRQGHTKDGFDGSYAKYWDLANPLH